MNYEAFEYNQELSVGGEVAAAAEVEKKGMNCTPLCELPLAMAYVPMQKWNGTYDACRALQRGTIFPELDLPFCGRRVK